MKYLLKIYRSLILALIMISGGLTVAAQADKIGNMLEEKRFVFKAETAIPMSLPSRNLSYGYDLQLNGANVVAYLPYFGTSYSAPVNPADNTLQFTSVQYGYKISSRKGRWEVTITPSDATDVRDMQLTVFTNGRATLQVNSTRRSPISFNGYIDAYGSK
jgi:hypothetical protein